MTNSLVPPHRRLPDNLTFAQGALLEPLSVVLAGLRRANLTLGRGALICGAGPIGLIALAASRASGAHPLVITDLEPSRLAFAKKLVPECEVYRVSRDFDAEGNAREIRGLFSQQQASEYQAPEVVLECTGVESSIVTAGFAVRRGGTVVVIGVGRPVVDNIPFMHLSLGEVGFFFSSPPPPPPPPPSSSSFHTLSLLTKSRSTSNSSTDTPIPGPRASQLSQEVY
jgi:L-iditol 2-dehydrogenase